MEGRCPRCGTLIEGQERFCANCGLALTSLRQEPPSQRGGVEGATGQSYAQIPPPPPAPLVGVPGTSGFPVAPLRPATPGSVVDALRPSRPASASFWVGLTLLIAALVLGLCPAGVALALAMDPKAGESASSLGPALGVFGCFFLGLVVVGVALVALGRPRRA